MDRNIYQRINEIRKAVEYVKKDKRVGEGGYMAVTHDAVTALTREHFIANGVVIVPHLESSSVQNTGTTTKSGTPIIRMQAIYRFEFVNVDDPADKITVSIEAHAIDQGDKAPGKVLSYAAKYAVLKLLNLESGEDEEGRVEQHKPKASKSVAQDVWESLPEAEKTQLTDAAMEIIGFLDEGQDGQAFEVYVTTKEKLDADQQVALWSRFTSTQRAAIKRLGEAHKKAEAKRKGKTDGT